MSFHGPTKTDLDDMEQDFTEALIKAFAHTSTKDRAAEDHVAKLVALGHFDHQGTPCAANLGEAVADASLPDTKCCTGEMDWGAVSLMIFSDSSYKRWQAPASLTYLFWGSHQSMLFRFRVRARGAMGSPK